MKILFSILIIVGLVGCADPQYHVADNKILYDANGCAFFVQTGDGVNGSFVTRVNDADKDKCHGQ